MAEANQGQSFELIYARLDSHEQLETLVLVTDEWTPENDLLTPTLKLKRASIEERYAGRVEAWYRVKSSSSGVDPRSLTARTPRLDTPLAHRRTSPTAR